MGNIAVQQHEIWASEAHTRHQAGTLCPPSKKRNVCCMRRLGFTRYLSEKNKVHEYVSSIAGVVVLLVCVGVELGVWAGGCNLVGLFPCG